MNALTTASDYHSPFGGSFCLHNSNSMRAYLNFHHVTGSAGTVMGWICFILLRVWAIWMVLINLPQIVGIVFKVCAGLFVIYLCIEAVSLIGRGLHLLSAGASISQ
jgi:hypothetical protein